MANMYAVHQSRYSSGTPWVQRSRSRSPPPNLSARITHLEEIICELQHQVSVLQSDRTWWNWWYNHWGKWLQNTVVRLSDAMVTFTDAWLAPKASRQNPDAAIDQMM